MSIFKKFFALFQARNKHNLRTQVPRKRFVTSNNYAIFSNIGHRGFSKKRVIQRYSAGFTYSIIKNKNSETRFLVRASVYTTAVMLVFSLFNVAVASLETALIDIPDNIIKDELIVKYRSDSAFISDNETRVQVSAKEKLFESKDSSATAAAYSEKSERASVAYDQVRRPANYYKLKLKSTESLADAYKNLLVDPNVESVNFNYLSKSAYAPNDTYYSDQWGLTKIDAGGAMDQTNGGSEDIVIAVIDQGIRGTHEDLYGKVLPGYDFYNNQTISANSNVYQGSHGTMVAGTAAAICNNGKGISGVACNSKLMPLQVFQTISGKLQATDGNIGKAIVYAVDNGADIINLSLGAVTDPQTVGLSPMYTDALRYAHDMGVVTVLAAGNGGADGIGDDMAYTSPGNISYGITVAASDQFNARPTFSNYGKKIDVAAPGINMKVPSSTSNSSYESVAGTSFSAPMTSGVVALMLSKNPNLSPEQVRQILRNTTTDVGISGFDVDSGYGVIDADAAVSAAENATTSEALLYDVNKTNVVKGTVNISGVAKGSGFASYKVEYGVGISPSSWTQITSSNTAVPSGILAANWNTTSLSGNYTVMLTVTNSDTSKYTSTMYINVSTTLPTLIVNNAMNFNTTTPVFTGTATASTGNITQLGYCMNIAINCYPTAVPITSAPSVNFSITTPALNAGANTILVVAYDSTGYSRYDGAFTIDLTVPTAPVITTPTDGAVISSTATDVSGRADPDTTVEVYVGSTTDGTTVKTDYDGTWIKTDVPLSSGTNAIKAIAIDPAGNHSVDSAIVNVTNGPGLLITGNTAQIAGTAFNITITAKTINGTTDTGFVGLVHFTSDDIQATLPIDYQFDSGDNGTHTFVAGVTLETAGNKTVSATVISGPSTYVGIFTKIFTVSSGEASIITKVSGDSQSAVVNRYLEDPLVVLVKDAYDNIVPNQTLNVVVTGGGGSVPSATILTGSNGIASTTFKMGPTVGDGNNTLTIGSSGLTPVTFTTSATVFVYNVTPGDGSFIGEGYDATIDSSDQQASVIFDKGAVTENTNVTVESLNLSHSALAGKIFVSGFYDFKAENELGDVVTTFPIDTVIMLLTNNDKLASSVNFETALVYFWNENTDAWDQTGVDTIYKSAFTSQAITTHFTGFAVMADSLVASPTPTTTPVDATNPSGGITKQATAVSVVKLPSTGINSMIIYEFIIAMICGFGLSFFHPQIMIKLRIRQ